MKSYFELDPVATRELSVVKRELSESRFENQILSYRLKDFQTSVAEWVDKDSKLQKTLMAKNIIAASRAPSSLPPMDMSSVLFQSVKTKFNDQDYSGVIKESKEIIEKYPTSVHVVESYFFTAEAYFKLKKFDKVTDYVDLMTQQYPDHILTGFLLLRLGQIYEIASKSDEANEVYQLVQKEFKQPEIQSQVRQLIKE